ncbi:MAG: IS5 family transposase [Caldilineaceae bacterium]|nr:IS5 family transposase [Caldilineaceae bacterium]
MDKQDTTKPKNVDYFHVPDELWAEIKLCLPEVPERQGPGHPRADDRAVWNGIWYHLWTGCQWKAIHVNWFGVCSSTIHERFQTWRKAGVFEAILRRLANYYAEHREIGREWQSIDSKSVAAPLADDASGRNPTDRGKQGSKIHPLVDERGAPLAVHVTGANEHDEWSADDLIVSIVVDRPDPQDVEQHFCADKGYDYDDVHETVEQAHYVPHIKHRRRRNEPVVEECPIPGELRYPARRWVVERTLGWLNKRRAIRTRWAKSAANWLALLQFASAHILFNMAIYG